MSAPPTGVLFYEARAKPLSTVGLIQPGAYYQFYLTGTLTFTNVYADGDLVTSLSQVPGTGGTTAASDGRLVPIYLDPNTIYRYQLYSAANVLLEDVDPFVPVTTAAPSGGEIEQLLYPVTTAETDAGIIPTTYLQYGWNTRYGMDPTGVTDSTTTFQTAINASWAMFNFVDGQGLWNGGGGAMPIASIVPGKYKLSGTTVLPTGFALQGQAHPANTTNYTRLIMNSTGITPVRTWTANSKIPAFGNLQVSVAGILTRFAATTKGTTGATVPTWPSGLGNTVTDGTVVWTNVGPCTNVDNRNTPMFRFSRANRLNGPTLMNQFVDSSVQNLEFWSVTLGDDFNNPLNGASPAYGDYPNGGVFFIDTDIIDTRITDCTFQNTPCGINMQNVINGHVASDGFTNQGELALFVERCEFDAAPAHILATNCNLDLTFRDCDFFDGPHVYKQCTGQVVYDNCRFYGGTYIDASDSGNSFTLFRINGQLVEQADAQDCVSIYGAKLLDIQNLSTTKATGSSTIVANLCSGGRISNNSINDSGFNASSTTGIGASAAIKLIDCKNVLVSNNNITFTDAASYNGFGILTISSTITSTANFITGNSITAPYNGGNFNGQGRYINVASPGVDIVGLNYTGNVSVPYIAGAYSGKRTSVVGATTTTIDCTQGNEFDITFGISTAYAIAAPLHPTDGMVINIKIINATGGALGTATWNAVFKLGAAAPAPNSGGNIPISFTYDGTTGNWRENFRSATSITN